MESAVALDNRTQADQILALYEDVSAQVRRQIFALLSTVPFRDGVTGEEAMALSQALYIFGGEALCVSVPRNADCPVIARKIRKIKASEVCSEEECVAIEFLASWIEEIR